MAVAAEAAVRAWINARPGLVGEGNPLSRGAYLRHQRSPEGGAYAVISRNSEGVGSLVAEQSPVATARIQCLVYAYPEQAAETAAAALLNAFESLTGCPEPCGDTGVTVLVASNFVGPFFIFQPDSEQYQFQVDADLVLRQEDTQ